MNNKEDQKIVSFVICETIKYKTLLKKKKIITENL